MHSMCITPCLKIKVQLPYMVILTGEYQLIWSSQLVGKVDSHATSTVLNSMIQIPSKNVQDNRQIQLQCILLYERMCKQSNGLRKVWGLSWH